MKPPGQADLRAYKAHGLYPVDLHLKTFGLLRRDHTTLSSPSPLPARPPGTWFGFWKAGGLGLLETPVLTTSLKN